MSDRESVYIAARFSKRPEAHELAKWLQERGHTITARWVKPNDDHVLLTGLSQQAADAERERFAEEDCEDMDAAQWCISLMEEPRNNSRGGRHIEFGAMMNEGCRLTVIGPKETVFHNRTKVIEHFDTVEGFKTWYERFYWPQPDNRKSTIIEALRDKVEQLEREKVEAVYLLKGARPPLNAKHNETQWDWFSRQEAFLSDTQPKDDS